jgi:hypothetical protein
MGNLPMPAALDARIAYGRVIRHRAECLIDAHGAAAAEEARLAAAEPGLSEADRHFWQAVADRLVRLTAPHRPRLH